MRKIEEQMTRAAFTGKAWQNGNTSVSPINDSHCAVYLHGHEIATVNHQKGTVMVNKDTLRAWPTVTTKSRLRALGADVYTRDYVVYLDGERV